ncbi:Leucine-rich repeat receptor-like protein kinase PXC2 [Forsythia ovata]|uniref:Leucine-rich repeat receptor-like protein kinase PXC2 n=1 Tax=Forsythia ovata TaxID=205694 RepID=A0ABD1UVS1_9LAMI
MLQILALSTNNISGNLPLSIANGLPYLEGVYLGKNQLSGEIPGCISNFSKLTVLDLSVNSFRGRVPMNLGNLQNLQLLNFDSNQLTNDPSMLELDFLISLKNCRQLKEIRISRNSFDGMLPRAWGNLSASIEFFSAYSSGIKGMIPNEIGDERVISIKNQFSGEIPSTIGQLQSLVNLTLSNNRLHSPIPESLGDLISLQYLDLSKNNLYGEIPRSLEKLKELVYFNVSFNELNGEIPNGGPFKNLTAYFFVGNSELCGSS